MASLPKLVVLSLCCAWLAGGCCGFSTDHEEASASMRNIALTPEIDEDAYEEVMVEEPAPTAKKKVVRKRVVKRTARKAQRGSIATCRKGKITLYMMADGKVRSPDWGGLSMAQRRACIKEAFRSS